MMSFSLATVLQPVTDSLATADASTTAVIANTENVSYLSFILKGGFMIYPLAILLFVCIYIIIERYMSLKKLTQIDSNLMTEIKHQLRAGKIENAALLCNKEGNSTSVILKSGINTIGRPISEIESVMEKQANIELAKMEKGMGMLGVISGVAPILGFIGTIIGVIRIFHDISTTGNLNIQTISGGLYEKMISSGAGLVVGVIAYAAYHSYNMWIDAYAAKIEEKTLDLIKVIQSPDGN